LYFAITSALILATRNCCLGVETDGLNVLGGVVEIIDGSRSERRGTGSPGPAPARDAGQGASGPAELSARSEQVQIHSE